MTQNREISFGYDPDPSRSSSLLSSAYTDHQWYDADLKASGKLTGNFSFFDVLKRQNLRENPPSANHQLRFNGNYR